MNLTDHNSKRRICCLCETWKSGGIESFLSNVLCRMDFAHIEVDFVASELRPSIFTSALQKKGVQFYELSGKQQRFLRRIKRQYHVQEFWADKALTFSLDQGDMLGIIGSNGAGKSTLLKAIAGIMEPTQGWVKRNGTAAALLELTSGFDGDLTVKENAYLRGAMLGYTRKFMDETFDRIIEFAELKEFQDRPFKRFPPA